jgi:hypothetical protein
MRRLSSILHAWGLANIPISEISDGLLMRVGVGRPLNIGSTIRGGCYVNGKFRVDFVVLIYFSKQLPPPSSQPWLPWHKHLGQSDCLRVTSGVSACCY